MMGVKGETRVTGASKEGEGRGEEGGGGGEGEEEGNDVIIAGRTTNQPKRKDRASQPMDHGRLR